MNREITSKSIIGWCKPVRLIVIGFVDSGACSGCDILTSLVYERFNVSTGLAAVCGNFVANHVQIQRGLGVLTKRNYHMCANGRLRISLVPKGLVTLRCLHGESLRSFK